MLLLILLFPLAESTFSHYERCSSDDCSYQIQASEENCIIYNTSMCSQMLNEIHAEDFKDLTYEDESKFKVLVSPYEDTFSDSESPLNIDYYAVNLSVSVFEKGIKQVALKLTGEKNVAKCRLFDFRKVSESIGIPVNLFYDCFHNFTSKYQFHLELMSLSTKEKLSYNVIIPPYEKIGTLCDWRPSIVIFTGSLDHGTVRVRFSQAPALLNVLSYEVSFIPSSKVELKTVVKIPANRNERMLLVEFHPAFSDTYNFTIWPLLLKNSSRCQNAEVVAIHVGFFKYGIEMAIILYLGIAVFGIIILLFLKYFINYINNLEPAFKPNVLLIHTINYLEEKVLASLFSDYLSFQHGCKVSSIYGEGKDPEKWCAERYQECNVIIIILSKGLFLTLDPKHSLDLKVHHSYCNQPVVADSILHNQRLQPNSSFREKKICRVCFSYSSPDDTPEIMKLTSGECFSLPKEMGSFLRFLFGCESEKYCSNLFSRKFNESKEFKALMKGVEDVHLASKQGLKLKYSPDALKPFACDDNAFENDSLILKNGLSGDLSEQDSFTESFIREIFMGASTSIVNESDNDRSCNESVECTEASKLLKCLEVIQNSELEIDAMLQQRVDKIMGHKEVNQV